MQASCCPASPRPGRCAVQIEYGPFQRRISLAEDVDPAAAEATYEHGLLTVVLPLAQKPRSGKVSIALGYIPTHLATADAGEFEIEIIGNRRPARLQLEPVFDPAGTRMRQ